MNRPTVEVADVFRAQGDNFMDQYTLGIQQLKVIRAITRCRTAALGGHADVCPNCQEAPVISYNSCRNRHCNKCQSQARERWMDARRQELLQTRYFHVVFTLPHELHTLVLQNQEELYNLLFRTVAETLREVARNSKHLGAEIGFFGILHTWGQNLLFHPHIHCVIPGGGISPDKERWIHPLYPFFLPVKALGKVFRGKFVDGLRRVYRKKQLICAGSIQHLEKPQCFSAFLRTLFRQNWVVYAKPAFGGPEQVIRYLGRYTHRVAHLEPPAHFLRRQQRYISLAGLCGWQQGKGHDCFLGRVHAPVSASRLAQRFCPYPALRRPGQLLPIGVHRFVQETPGDGAAGPVIGKRATKSVVAMPAVSGSSDRHPETDRC